MNLSHYQNFVVMQASEHKPQPKFSTYFPCLPPVDILHSPALYLTPSLFVSKGQTGITRERSQRQTSLYPCNTYSVFQYAAFSLFSFCCLKSQFKIVTHITPCFLPGTCAVVAVVSSAERIEANFEKSRNGNRGKLNFIPCGSRYNSPTL